MCKSIKRPKIEDMLELIETDFKSFKDPRSGFPKIRIEDFLKSSLAVFGLKQPSLLKFEEFYSEDELIFDNIKRLYNIENIPSDTHLRDILDLVEHHQYRKVFKNLFAYVQKTKLLEQYSYIEVNDKKYYLVAVDGTGYFGSQKLNCKNCTTYEYKDRDNQDKKRFGHHILAASIVHPHKKTVIPFFPEPIIKQDGTDKNDCEYNAFIRFLEHFQREHYKLNVIFVLDALYANTPLVNLLNEKDIPFIISVKNNKAALFRQFGEDKRNNIAIREVDTSFSGEKVPKRTVRTYDYTQNLKLGQDMSSATVHMVDFNESTTWRSTKGEDKETKRHFSFITNIEPTPKSVRILVEGGRARWKIENETFNTLKNQGYYLEHNYGHGQDNLSLNFINSMFLAFMLDQIQEASCTKFKRALEKKKRKSTLFTRIFSVFDVLEMYSWSDVFDRLAGIKKNSS